MFAEANWVLSPVSNPSIPTIKLKSVDVLGGEFDYSIIDYESHPTIKAPLNN